LNKKDTFDDIPLSHLKNKFSLEAIKDGDKKKLNRKEKYIEG